MIFNKIDKNLSENPSIFIKVQSIESTFEKRGCATPSHTKLFLYSISHLIYIENVAKCISRPFPTFSDIFRLSVPVGKCRWFEWGDLHNNTLHYIKFLLLSKNLRQNVLLVTWDYTFQITMNQNKQC